MTPEDTTPPAPTPKPKRKTPAVIDTDLTRDTGVARDCHREAAKSGISTALEDADWAPASQVLLGESLGRCEAIVLQIGTAKSGKIVRTDEEEDARKVSLAALLPIQKGARRTFPEGNARRRDFGVGIKAARTDTNELIRIVKAAYELLKSGTATTSPPPQVVLKGVKAPHIEALRTTADTYRDADFAQADAKQLITQFLNALRAEVQNTLNPLRRDLQIAVDQKWPHTMQPNPAAIRRAFHIPEDQPATT